MVVPGAAWGVYLFYLGLTPVLKTPIEQAVPFTLVSGLAILVVNIVLHALASLFRVPYF
jgi:hypothetical protein